MCFLCLLCPILLQYVSRYNVYKEDKGDVYAENGVFSPLIMHNYSENEALKPACRDTKRQKRMGFGLNLYDAMLKSYFGNA